MKRLEPWLRQRSPLHVAIALVVLIAAVVAVLAIVPLTRHRIEWGTAPGWLTVVGGAVAIIGVAVSIQSLQTTQRHRLDDEKSQARLLVYGVQTSWDEDHPDGPRARLVVTTRNASTDPLHFVRVVGVAVNGAPCTLEPEQAYNMLRDSAPTLAPNENQTSDWTLPAGVTPGRVSGPSLAVGHIYLDNAGRSWRRLNDRDPVRQLHSTMTEAEDEAFRAAMRRLNGIE